MVSPYKERFIAQAGKEVPLDYFLYSCFEAENTIHNLQKKAGGKDKVDFRHPDLNALTPDLKAALGANSEAWEKAIATLFQWHGEREPALLENLPLDYERVSSVTAAFAVFYADFRDLYGKVSGESLPVFDEAGGLAPVWQSMMRVMDAKVPSNAYLLSRFFAWTHSAWEAPVYEIGSRPPVGRFAPPPRIRTAAGGDGASRNARGFDKGSSQDRPRRQEGRVHGYETGPSENRRPNILGARQETRDEPRHGAKHDERKGHRKAAGREDRMDPEALSAVESAIEKLERDPSTRFVDLPPTNSFQRRKQHHTISERGFQSQSVGEGENRAVRVLRGQQA
jgi:hypothetical protein